LAGWRFITGIGLGGALPNATALLAEFAPPRWRNQAIAAAIVGVPIGGMFGSLIAAELIVFSGWRALFVVGGVLPLAAAAVMFLTMPESPRYLAVRGRQTARLASMLNRLAPGSQFTADDRFVLDAVPVRSTGSLSVIFSLAYLRDTLGSWMAFATNIFAVYSFFSWSPVVLTSLGLDLSSAVRGSFYFNLAGISGALVNAWLIARFGSRLPLIGMCLFGVTALSALAWLTQNAFTDPGATIIDDTALMLGVAGAGLAINAVQIGMYAVVANVYPTACRSSGVGWALGVGRIGGIVSAFAGSMLLTQAGGAGFFGGIAVALSLTFVAVALIRRHIPPSG
ncbi:MAG TPA: MFS transporter, partial [Lysobacter sp.]